VEHFSIGNIQEKRAMEKIRLNVLKEFSRTPGPRHISEGDYSGELFLRDVLAPKFQEAINHDLHLSVDLDGTAGYATSFLEEAFGGLARQFGSDEILRRIEFITEDEPYLEEDITTYIKEANLAQMVMG
jgi:hypothetical protein